MFEYFVIFLFIAGGTTASDCTDVIFYCDEPSEVPDGFPATEEELQEFCTPAISMLECEYRLIEKCKDDLPEKFEFATRVMSTVKEVCNEDTLLHAVFVNNLKCFSKLVNNMDMMRACPVREESTERIQQLAEALSEEGLVALSDNENDTIRTHQCIQPMNFLACYALLIDRECGADGMDVFVDIVQKVVPGVVPGCDESYELLPAVIRLRRLGEEAERRIEEALRRRKK